MRLPNPRETSMPAISLSGSYSQNFDTLLSSLPPSSTSISWADDTTIAGWYSNRTTYLPGTGSSNTGALYSFGSAASSAERALGSVASGGTGTIFYGARFVNNTANTLSSLTVSYTGEQWRTGGSATTTPSVAQTLDFQYQIGATGLTTGTWVDFNALDFTTPTFGTTTASALDGNAAANRSLLSATLNNLNLAPGQEIWLRWQDINDVNNDHGVAIDNLTVAAEGTIAAGVLVTQSDGMTSVTEGGATDTYTIALSSQPTADVTIAIGPDSQTTTNVAALTFTSANWNQSQTVTVTAVDDAVVEGNHSGTIGHTATSTDPNYSGISIASISAAITDNDIAATIRIRDIQGAGHLSPLVGQRVSNVPGMVTVLRSNGFYLQDPDPDANDATSEGIFVFTSSAPSVAIGDSILVSGTVSEFRPGNNANNLTLTQISGSPTIVRVSSGNSLPGPIVLGTGGWAIPTQVIDDDANGNVETSGTFDPATDGIDFYESLEGMRVQVNNAVAAGPTNNFGEIPVLADNGANAGLRTSRGGIIIQSGDFNPERIIIDDAIIASEPQVNVGDRFEGAIVGVIDYSFSNFKLLNTQPLPTPTAGNLQREVTSLAPTPDQLTVATFNVENLDPGDGATKFSTLAARIVSNLRSPDIINLEEVQDNNGPTNDSVVDATVTYQTLIDAIVAAGGPRYEFRQINPVDDQDGGEPGGNIRVGFLFNPNRVQFVDRPGGGSLVDTIVNNVSGTPQLSASPGRIDPDNSAFNSSRKPLVGEFVFNGQTVFVIGNHFNSKGGDQPLFGPNQPPTLNSEVQRLQQATIVRNFVQQILAIDPGANVIVAGDLNDFEFSNPINLLEAGGLANLIETLPANERYTYNFEGNAQTLDHILVSQNLRSRLDGFDVVHINSEFADQISDHDPVLARFNLPTPINRINGTAGNDMIVGTPAIDIINAGAGNDTVSSLGGNDEIFGDRSPNPASTSLLFRLRPASLTIEFREGSSTPITQRVQQNGQIPTTFGSLQFTAFDNTGAAARTWVDQGEAIGIEDSGDRRANSALRKRIEGGERLQISIVPQSNYNSAFGAAITLDRFAANSQATVVAYRNGVEVDRESFTTANFTFYSEAAFDQLVLQGDVGQFTFRSISLSGVLNAAAAGNDVIDAGAGNDVIFAGAGRNVVTGGAGNDKFALTSLLGTTIVTDFTNGEDTIGLAGRAYDDLTIVQGTGANQNDMLIKLRSTNQLLAILQGVQFDLITAADFYLIPV
jgi:predicted extracellular nuclease